MSDIATVWSIADGVGDWSASPASVSIWTDASGDSIVDGAGQPIDAFFTAGEGMISGSDLVTAVLISLFTDAAADPDDVIPDGSGDARGWWGAPIGSKLWLRGRSKQTPLTLELVKNDIRQALQWMIDDDVVAKIDVATEFTMPGLLGAQIVLRRQDGASFALKFSRLWEAL